MLHNNQHLYYSDCGYQNWNWDHQMTAAQRDNIAYVNPAFYPTTQRDNISYVNPAFYPPPQVFLNHSLRQKIYVNPKFFPSIRREVVLGNIVNGVLNVKDQHISCVEVKPVRLPAENISQSSLNNKEKSNEHSAAFQTDFGKGLHAHVNNKYSWKRAQSSGQTNNAYLRPKDVFRLVRKSPLRSPKPPHKSRHIVTKLFSPPRLASAPLHSSVKSRFKIDNRLKKKPIGKLMRHSRALSSRVAHSKPHIVLKRSLKTNVSIRNVNRAIVNRIFTSFKSPLSRSLVAKNKRFVSSKVKNVKAKKTVKVRSSKRYYDNKDKTVEETKTLPEEELEIVEKPSNINSRKPLGCLPSFITL